MILCILASILTVILTVQYSIHFDKRKHFFSWLIHIISIVFILGIEFLQLSYTLTEFYSEFAKMYVIGLALWLLLPIYGRSSIPLSAHER